MARRSAGGDRLTILTALVLSALVVACGDSDGAGEPTGPSTPPAAAGALQASVSTSGMDVDTDGYTLNVDGVDVGAISVEGSVEVSDLTAGSHSVLLAGLQSNCAVEGANPATVEVPPGDAARITFLVVCELIQTSFGGNVVFASDRDGGRNIFSMRGDRTGLTKLTSSGTDDAPVFSPDGARIAFHSARDGNHEIYVMNADGSRVTRLTDQPGADRFPAWSPDGTRIAFESNRDGDPEIYVMAADGTNPERVTDSALLDTWPSWFPDGERILFVSQRGGEAAFFVADADGSAVEPLVGSGGAGRVMSKPAFSPDGAMIVYAAAGSGLSDLFTLNLQSGIRSTVAATAGLMEEAPVWSPDGQRILFQRHFRSPRQAEEPELWVVDAGQDTRMTYWTGWDGAPSWSQ